MAKKEAKTVGYSGSVRADMKQNLSYLLASAIGQAETAKKLKEQIDGMQKDYDGLGHFVQVADNFLEAEDGKYKILAKDKKKIGDANVAILEKLAAALTERDDLAEGVGDVGGEPGAAEFALNRIAELDTPPYTELEAARADETKKAAYAKLIASTMYEEERTYATDWVEEQIESQNDLIALNQEILDATEQIAEILAAKKKPEKKDSGKKK
jgi:hypothetical protein